MKPAVEVLHRSRFQPLPSALAERIAANAWEIVIPIDATVRRFSKTPEDPASWDGVVFSIDGVETEPAIGSGGDATAVRVTVLVL